MSDNDENPYRAPIEDCDRSNGQLSDGSCPQCGESMELGRLRSIGSIDWVPFEEAKSFRLSKVAARIRISGKSLSLSSRIPASRCKACGTIVVVGS